ncbi:hypothetical protein ASC90_17295 [Rhizobium sp. Root1220]|nr:hypothetical protein ASC90_17295 [Rhizobium sp. Root1220]
MDRIDDESFRLCFPPFADKLEGRKAIQGPEATAKFVRGDEASAMGLDLIMAVIVEALEAGLLYRAVQAFYLAIGPRCLGLVSLCSISWF